MKFFFRLFGIWLLLGCAQVVWAQATGPKIDRVDIKFVGPASVSEQFIRSNIRVKAGDIYHPNSTQDDIHSLYGTGQFYNIRVTSDLADDGGVVLTYIVQACPRITEITLQGNKELSNSKLKKKITSKIGDPLDEEKLFTAVQAMKKLYEQNGYPDTQIKYVLNIDEAAGRGSVTFEIVEAQKIKITKIEFIGATNFTQKVLLKQIKTKQHWMFSWLTGSGVFKQDDFDDDRDALSDFYRNHGFLDFEITDVKFDYPVTNKLALRIFVSEGRQYKVGSVKFTGNKIFSIEDIRKGLQVVHDYERSKDKLGTNNLAMDVGDTFTPDGLAKDSTAIEDFYGGKGYIDVERGNTLRVIRIPNVDAGTMDLEFQIDEGDKYLVEKIDIRGNLKTKDSVIRRELAISPGETFDMVRVKLSKQRLEGLQYFDKVDMDPEPTDPPIAGRKNLEINVEEQNTGNFTLGAGLSSDSGISAFAEITQGNFDLFHPPYFTGGGQKARLFLELGTREQDYELEFTEPWFLNRKLALDINLYRKQLNYESPHNIFDETRTGTKVSLTRALGSDFLIGSVSYDIEDVGITLNNPYHGTEEAPIAGTVPPIYTIVPPNVPQAIMSQVGDHVFNRFGASLAYDTRNSTQLPNHGQRTEIDPEFDVGDTTFAKLELKTAWYFPGLMKGDVIEAVGRAGAAQGLSGGDVPFYDRYYLGGLYSLRGFQFRNIGPRDPAYYPGNPAGIPNEPIGGDSYWFGSVEYSIPIIEKEAGASLRFALFYDAGDVGAKSYSFSGNFDDDWGVGFRLDIPHLGPLRLDYGIPINHDKFNGSSGQFQFGFGYTRQF